VNKYEALYVINPALEEQAQAQLIERFSGIVAAGGGNVEKVDDWGIKKLAYPINYITEGRYILMTFESAPALPAELERNMKNNEFVIRFMVTTKA